MCTAFTVSTAQSIEDSENSDEVKVSSSELLPRLFDPSTFKDAASISTSTSSWHPAYRSGMKELIKGKYAAKESQQPDGSLCVVIQAEGEY